MKAFLEYIEGYKRNESVLDANISDLTDAIVNMVDIKSTSLMSDTDKKRMDMILEQTSAALCALRKIKAALNETEDKK